MIEKRYVITVEFVKFDSDELWKATVDGFPWIKAFEDSPEEACCMVLDAVETLRKNQKPTQLDLFE